ncbi:TQO small subunit DoxD [Deinococcus aerius]|uniref:TQO small subunit DoxD n=1 Tax=Deinococcus aerius TaxID=200253 RepID=A0A2I9DKN7_9DEIO|nr:DoxX family membrane protein [Deinococcus aerius]GBF06988.1 TQO small subunit DoxD [Deinococcus aerius]
MTAQANPPRVLIEPRVSRFLFADTRLAPLWTLLRIYVGWQWLEAGWHKVTDPAWVGGQAGTAVTGFLRGALAKTGGERPSVSGWYGWFIENVALPNATLFSYLVTFGELAVGTALILGLLTGIAAFFGGLMNANFLLAGTLSSNPLLFILATWLVLAWRVAGWWGLDRWVLPRLGVFSAPSPEAGTPGARPESHSLR